MKKLTKLQESGLRKIVNALKEERSPEINPKDLYYGIGDYIVDLKYYASAENNDPDILKIQREFTVLHAKLKKLFDAKFGKWD